jgi:acetyl-CoA carboxylase biotin carboxyl carrier protein
MTIEIRAELVATVSALLVALGDPVKEGQTLMMVESMKMEIPVVAEASGTVTEIRVHAGKLVNEGDIIAVISE